jgi:REP element-mobilizing transposase RayT
LEKLCGSLANYAVELHAYVLMSNHFHLLVATTKGNLSAFMRHFNISYTAAFNRRHRRVGHLYPPTPRSQRCPIRKPGDEFAVVLKYLSC